MRSATPSTITYLPLAAAAAKKKGIATSSSPAAATTASHSVRNESLLQSSSSRMRATLASFYVAARTQRVKRFFQRKASQREVFAQVRANPVARVTHKLQRLATLFAKSNCAGLKAKLQVLVSGGGRGMLKHSLVGFARAIRGVYTRIRGGNSAELLQQALLREQQLQRHQAFLRHVFHALAIQGRNLLRGKRNRLRRELCPSVASGFVAELLEAHVPRTSILVCAQREAVRLRRHVIVIQHTWRRACRREQYHRESKRDLLALLSTMTTVLQQEEKARTQRLEVLRDVCLDTHTRIMHGAVRRFAVRLIQRVWRGYRARRFVFALCAWRRKKESQKLQRERLRKAREALLAPSLQEQRRQRILSARIQSRQQATPLLVPPGHDTLASDYFPLTHARATLLKPLHVQHTPPKISRLRHAKTQKVPFSKFEQICAQHAKVNASNLWVAIPVGFYHGTEDDAIVTQGAQHKHKTVMTTKKKKKNRFFAAQYDWVPATLLRHESVHKGG
uniref:Uncharacterized protein n=1 Tax=Globisporangium ultimum (strain ATCC 200006 / CBS 805.95 / DAOM BR144) TaxID=431595 RepID=K3XCA8_GLOUD